MMPVYIRPMRYIDCSPQARYVSKNAGRSAVAKFDYVTRSGKYSRHRDRAIASGSLGLPAFAHGDARAYWQAADDRERKNGATLYEYIMPLPCGLSEQQQVALCEKFAHNFRRAFTEGAPVVSWGLHEGHGDNPHLHFCFGTRLVDERAALWPADKFFKRCDGTERGGAGRLGTNEQDKEFLESVKDGWRRNANTAAHKAGVPVTLIGGPLHLTDEQRSAYIKKGKTPPVTQREQAAKAMNAAQKAGDGEKRAAAYWWWIKTHRPVTTHLGQSANRERKREHDLAKDRRDYFLLEAAASAEIALIERNMPVPSECAELAARWRIENPGVFPELNPEYAAALAQPAPSPAKPKPRAAIQPPRRPKEKKVEEITEEMKPRRGEGVDQFIARRRRQSGAMPKKSGRIYATALQPADLEKGRAFGSRYKLKLWEQIYKVECSGFAAEAIGYIYTDTRTIKTKSGVLIRDAGKALEASKFDAQSIALMIEQASAKGWTDIEIEGGDEAVRAEFRKAGFNVVGAGPAESAQSPVSIPAAGDLFDPLGLGAKRAAEEEKRRREIEEQVRRRAAAEEVELPPGPAI